MSNHAISGTVLCLAATFILSPAQALTQQELVAKGYSVSTAGVDGDFGSATYRATVAFQRDYALGVDGIIGPTTCSPPLRL